MLHDAPTNSSDRDGGDAPQDVCWAARARQTAAEAVAHAAALDSDDSFPAEEIASLHRSGLLHAVFPRGMGGGDLFRADRHGELREVLAILGGASLALGRLYEGHVNAVVLVCRYGSRANLDLLMEEVDQGRPSGVWMAGPPLRLLGEADQPRRIEGFKLLASGTGHIRRPLVAADDAEGSLMLLPFLGRERRGDTSAWRARGMRATATGTVDFTGIAISDREIVGRHGDYLRPPFFRGGAWRVIAVQFGGLTAIFDEYRRQLGDSPHREHPIQLARFGQAKIAFETARLWVAEAATVTADPGRDPDAIDAYVDLARNAFEAAALHVCAAAQKAIGLKAFLRENPLERLVRDLETYLRQPALDASLMAAARFHLTNGSVAEASDKPTEKAPT